VAPQRAAGRADHPGRSSRSQNPWNQTDPLLQCQRLPSALLPPPPPVSKARSPGQESPAHRSVTNCPSRWPGRPRPVQDSRKRLGTRLRRFTCDRFFARSWLLTVPRLFSDASCDLTDALRARPAVGRSFQVRTGSPQLSQPPRGLCMKIVVMANLQGSGVCRSGERGPCRRVRPCRLTPRPQLVRGVAGRLRSSGSPTIDAALADREAGFKSHQLHGVVVTTTLFS